MQRVSWGRESLLLLRELALRSREYPAVERVSCGRENLLLLRELALLLRELALCSREPPCDRKSFQYDRK